MTENTQYSPQPSNTEFTDVVLEADVTTKKKKEPRRVVHFSDGVLEEYSTDEEDDQPPPPPPVNPKTLSWVPWMWHYASTAAVKTLGAADMCGEKLAWFFGITSPKYQSAIDEFYRLKAEEEKEEEQICNYQKNMALLTNVSVVSSTGDKSSTDGDIEKF